MEVLGFPCSIECLGGIRGQVRHVEPVPPWLVKEEKPIGQVDHPGTPRPCDLERGRTGVSKPVVS